MSEYNLFPVHLLDVILKPNFALELPFLSKPFLEPCFMLFWYIVDTFMARIVSCLTPGFNNYFEKLLVVSACGIATYVRSRRREMRFRKYKMVEAQGIEPWTFSLPWKRSTD